MFNPTTALQEIIKNKTLYGIVYLNTDIKKAWGEYLEYVKLRFPNTTDLINKTAQQNEQYITQYLEDGSKSKLIRSLHFNFFDDEDLLKKIKERAEPRATEIFNITSDNPIISDFISTGKGGFKEIIKKAVNNSEYGIDDIVFLLAVYKDLFLEQLPANCQTYLNEKPTTTLQELGLEWSIAKKKLLLGILHSVDITDKALDNELDISKLTASINSDIKVVVDVIKKVKRAKTPTPQTCNIEEHQELIKTSERQWIAIAKLVKIIDELSLKGVNGSLPTPPDSKPTTPAEPAKPAEPEKSTPTAEEIAWSIFYSKYNIINKDKWSAYKNASEAEAIFINAVNSISGITSIETNLINNSKTPQEVAEAVIKINTDRKIEADKKQQEAETERKRQEEEAEKARKAEEERKRKEAEEAEALKKRQEEEAERKRIELLKKAELEKYNDLLMLIIDPIKTTFKSLPENYQAEEIKNLNNDLLPADKQKETLTAKIIDRRSSFVLSLNKLDDNGFEADKLTAILAKKKEKWEAKFSKVLDVDVLCELLKDNVKELGITKTADKQKNRDLEQYLLGYEDEVGNKLIPKAQRGYRIDTEPELEIKVEGTPQKIKGADVWTQEEEWIKTKQRDKQGKLLLPFAYKKNNFDPDNLTDASFCKWTKNEKGNKVIDPTAGTLAIGTGWGKTTRTVSCLQWIVEEK